MRRISLLLLILLPTVLLSCSNRSFDDNGTLELSSEEPTVVSDDIFDELYPMSLIIDEADFDIDGDGTTEHCTVTPGPTSGLYTLVITAGKYKNTFSVNYGDLRFNKESEKPQILFTYADSGETKACDIVIRDRRIVLEGLDSEISYWGDDKWNNDLKHIIKYELGDLADLFSDTPEFAGTGETVRILAKIMLDAGIHVYRDGEEIKKTHEKNEWWEYSFTMPDRDVTITAKPYTKEEIWVTHN